MRNRLLKCVKSINAATLSTGSSLFVCIRLKASNLCAGSLKFDIDQDNDSWQHILCCENLRTEVDMVKLLN